MAGLNEFKHYAERLKHSSDIVPEFVINSTVGVMLTTLIVVTPFAIINLINGRYLVGGLSLIVAALSVLSARSCHKGEYSRIVNLFLMTPLIILTITIVTVKVGIIGTFWAFLAVLSFYFILTERNAWIANSVFILIMIPASWTALETEVFVRFVIMIIVTSAFAIIFIRIINDQHELLEKQAVTDSMTGLYNRSLLQTSLERSIRQYQRSGIKISLIIADIDHFKSINDDFGHEKGDQVIHSFSTIMKESFRGTDMLFRIGGEEFLAILHDADETKARNIAEKFRAKIAESSLIPDRCITISQGVSEFQSDWDWNQWMKHSDDNLYQAKSGGRNRVVSFVE